MDKKEIMNKFYGAFQKKDWKTMNSLYHKDCIFRDAIFENLSYKYVTNMWQMLLDKNENMNLTFSLKEKNGVLRSYWVSNYTFGPKKRHVTNIVIAEMEIKDDKIIRHHDSFNFSVWAKQAIGLPAYFFSKSKWFHKKVAIGAMNKLEEFIKNKR